MYNEQKTNGALTKDKSKCHNWNAEKVYRFEILIHNQREEEIERGYEEEREGSPIPIFTPLCFRIARMLAGWMGLTNV